MNKFNELFEQVLEAEQLGMSHFKNKKDMKKYNKYAKKSNKRDSSVIKAIFNVALELEKEIAKDDPEYATDQGGEKEIIKFVTGKFNNIISKVKSGSDLNKDEMEYVQSYFDMVLGK